MHFDTQFGKWLCKSGNDSVRPMNTLAAQSDKTNVISESARRVLTDTAIAPIRSVA